MVKQRIDDVTFRLKEACDFSFLSKYGKVFCVFDETGSGCISFGVTDGIQKYFIKIAGAKTIKPYLEPIDAITALKNSMQIYSDLKHPNLIKLLEHYEQENLYVAVFKWVSGVCLFDHWNFEMYSQNPQIIPPKIRFKNLPIEKKLKAFYIVFDFLMLSMSKGYVAVDFYDGSIIYDFENDCTTICDIDFFRKKPAWNDMGINYFGTKRLKAPEEYVLGAVIDERTSVFMLGALLCHYFGNYTDIEIKSMYENCCFTPCLFETWQLNKRAYDVVMKAVSSNRLERYMTIQEFYNDWNNSCK